MPRNRFLILVCLAVAILGNGLLGLHLAVAGSFGVRQPTDPCDKCRCSCASAIPAYNDFTLKAKVERWEEAAYSSDKIKQQTVALSSEELDRMRACSAVVKRYRPNPGGSLVSMHEREYFAKCFHSVQALPAGMKATLPTIVARLNVPVQDKECTAIIVNSRMALTARHCFLEHKEGIAHSIPAERFHGASLEGVDGRGKRWIVKGLGVLADPFATGTSLYARFQKSRTDQPRENFRDFIVIGPFAEHDAFPLPTAIRFPEVQEVKNLIQGHVRFVLPAYSGRGTSLLVDTMPSCDLVDPKLDEGFFKHHCQSLPGASGAPMVLYSPGPPYVLFGLHEGLEGTFGNPGSRRENEAIFFPSELIEELQEQRDGAINPAAK